MKIKHEERTSSRRDAATKKYAAAVESLPGLQGEDLRNALMRAHNAHADMLMENGFASPQRLATGGKSAIVVIKKF